MKEYQKKEHIMHDETKSFEDAAFEMLSTVSPVKLPREDIPFDSVRQIVINEIIKSKQSSSNGRNMEDLLLDEAVSSSSSSSHVGESSSSVLERGTMTDEGESCAPRPIAARLYGDCTRSSSTSTSSAPCGSSDTTADTKKKSLNYREKRLAEIRTSRLKKYRENVEVFEFKCEENCLRDAFARYYQDILDDDVTPANLYYRIVESLDVYFRAKTWESNCPKLLCEFLCEHVLKTCQQLNVLHESKNAPDEYRAKECQIQVLLTLHVLVVTSERRWLDESINKLRMIYISVGAERLRTFVEETVTDIYLDLVGEGLATIYDELCINLPADLQQYDNGLFKMTEADDPCVVKRRNGAANRLEQMLIETSSDLGIGGVERTTRTSTDAPPTRKSLKRRNTGEIPQELLSPTRPTRSGAASRTDFKKFFVEDTPDEKYHKKTAKKEIVEVEEDQEKGQVSSHGRKKIAIKEEIEEEVKQTPMAKLRAAANKNGKRCSKRLSDLVKLSEERAQIPKKARENFEKILEKAKTPIRSITRPTRKSVLFGSTPTSSPAGMNTRGNPSRASLLSKFPELVNRKSSGELSIDTSGGHDIHTPTSSSESTTPVLRERSSRRRPARFSDSLSEKQKPKIKQEIEDPDFDAIEATPSSKRSAKNSLTPSSSAVPPGKWTDRQLKRQLGLTREDLNRYREAMMTTGERNRNKNLKINWESAQVNRAGRVKGAGASEDGTPIFGIARRNVRTMICHVLLNDANPDISFDWNKVKFDDFVDKPRTRHFQSLIQKPEAYMQTLKQKYIEARNAPLKRLHSGETSSSSSSNPCTKRRRISAIGSPKKRSRSSGIQSCSGSSTKSLKSPTTYFDDFGFESEADD